MERREEIPEEMKRNIRRRCGYGCVICGKPIYEYHHIYGYKKEIRNIETEITLLCDEHHKKERKKMITKAQIIEADADPYNYKSGYSTPDQLWYCREPCTVELGSYHFDGVAPGSTPFVALMLDDNPVMQFTEEDGNWLLSLSILDPWNRPQISIIQNEVSYLINEWDVECVGSKLTIRDVSNPNRHVTYFEAEFTPPIFRVLKAIFQYDGIAVNVDHRGLVILNPGSPIISNIKVSDAAVGLLVGRNPNNITPAVRAFAKNRFLWDNGPEEPRIVDERVIFGE